MDNPNFAIIVDPGDLAHLPHDLASKLKNSKLLVMPYRKLRNNIGNIKDSIDRHQLEYVIFSRNEQVASRVGIGQIIRSLRTGYSSFSGIDDTDRITQMKNCFSDMINGSATLRFPKLKKIARFSTGRRPTFSLIFDCEQLGGVRYGLPRILAELNRSSIRATFFITNLMADIYTNLIGHLLNQGHEVGIHGLYHEYLTGLPFSRQKNHIARIRDELGVPIKGANFIGRMDNTTVQALADNKIEYFVYPAINIYRYFAYTRGLPPPMRIKSQTGCIYALPITMETYGLPLFSVYNIAKTLCAAAKRSAFNHISVLCHPFRDGSIKRISSLIKLTKLFTDNNREAVTLTELITRLKEKNDNGSSEIHGTFPMDDRRIPGLHGIHMPKHERDLLFMPIESSLHFLRRFQKGRTIF